MPDMGWELKGRLTSDQQHLADPVVVKLELFARGQAAALWTKTLKWKAGTCPARGKTEFDGRLADDLYPTAEGAPEVSIVWHNRTDFPEGVLTVDHSPYKLKLTLVEAGQPRSVVARWVYLDVLVHSLKVYWGDKNLLPPLRPDVHANYQERILGHKKDVSKANDKDVAGFEELLLGELKAAHPQPTAGVVHEVKLTSDLYAFQQRGQEHKEAYELNTDFTSYQDLWGNGARIPLLVQATIKKSNGEATEAIPAALGGAKILWDWEDNQPQRWKSALSAGKAPKTEPFLTDAYQRNNDAKPAALSNCPAEFGGKRGAAGAASHVFPVQPPGNGFLVEVQPCAVRKWAALSSFGTGEERDASGVIFQPSRLAGDSYTIKAYLQFPRDADSEDAIQAPPELQTESFEFKVFRRLHLNSLVRGAAKLGTPPATLEADLKADYLKELDMDVVVNSSTVDNTAYKAALRTAIDRVCNRTHFVDEVKNIPFLPLLAREAVDTNPPADSAGVVYRNWTTLEAQLENKFLNSKLRLVSQLTNGAAFADEEVRGQTSGAQGVLLTVNAQRYLLYPSSGADFQSGEQLLGQSTGTAGTLTLDTAHSCWGRNIQVNPVEGKAYKEQIKVVFPVTHEEWIQYEKHHLKLKTDIPLAAQNTLRQVLATTWQQRREANACNLDIYARDDTTNAQNRAQTLKTFLDQLFQQNVILDRQAIWTAVKAEIISKFDRSKQKMLALLLVGEIIWEYAAQQHPGDEGIFLLHVPGLFEACAMPSAAPIKQPKVMGAVFPELTGDGNAQPFRHRHHAVAYLATVPNAAADLTYPTKSLRATFKHELAHALFLPHSPGRVSKTTPSPHPECHVKGDSCLMNYDLNSDHFCGLCMMRMRGWNWQANALANQVTAVRILDGTADTYLLANGIQHVNLPVADKWVDGVHILNKDRLGRKIKVKVEFQQEVAGENVYLQLLAHHNNSGYSATEQAAKPSYKVVRQPAASALGTFDQDQGPLITGVTDKDGNYLAEFEVPAASGDQYKLYAEDDGGNRVTSVELTTWRTLYYMVLRYAHPNSVPTPQITNTVNNAFNPNFTNWIFAGEVIDPANRSFVSADPTHAATTNLIRTATQVACANLPGKQYQDLEPFLSRIVLIDMCIKVAKPIETTPVQTLVGVGSPLARIEIRNAPDVNNGGIIFDQRKGLYHNQGPNESLTGGQPLTPPPPGNEYFVRGAVTLLRQTALAEVLGRVTAAGNARITVTAAGMNNSPKIVNVPIVVGDGTNAVAAKIRTALGNDGDVAALFDVSGEFQYVTLVKKAAGAHDATLNIAIANGTCVGLTAAPTAVNTPAGAVSPRGILGISIPLNFAAVTPIIADAVNRPGGFIEADVQVNNLTLNGLAVPQQNASISLTVYVLNTFVAGMARLAAPDAKGILIIPAAYDFKPKPHGGQLNSIIHELGHCLGMVANVAETQNDTHQYHYNMGTGDHCSSGLPRTVANTGASYQTQANEHLAGLCVMFGFTSNINPRTNFCVDCEKVLKKIDSSGGLL